MKEKKIYILILKIKKLKNFSLLENKYNLIKAKIDGFFLDDKKLKKIYGNNNKIESFYAYTLRNYRVGKIKKALN